MLNSSMLYNGSESINEYLYKINLMQINLHKEVYNSLLDFFSFLCCLTLKTLLTINNYEMNILDFKNKTIEALLNKKYCEIFKIKNTKICKKLYKNKTLDCQELIKILRGVIRKINYKLIVIIKQDKICLTIKN